MSLFEVGDEMACAVCCGGRHTPVPDELKGKVESVMVARDGYTTYMVRLPNNMIDILSDATGRPYRADQTQTSKMRHALA